MIKRRLLTAVAAVVLAAGCATTAPPPDERHPQDPWEPYNRNMFKFNMAVDQAVVRPVAIGYDRITPEPAQKGIRNFFRNIRSPIDFINLILQGRPKEAGTKLMRFTANTVFGIGGLFDVATPGGVPEHRADFGQTLAKWGWKDSRYLVLPVLGPSSIRDGIGRGGDAGFSFAWRWVLEETSYGWILLDGIQARHALLPLDADIQSAYDPYIFMRDAWLQRRAHLTSQGEEELPDYDAFLDELDDYDDD
ncbi:MAG TPA: VacJ family lipoprotein [Wenzhouxiangella sp.]|nr:VacJ family lipoprotein [Wenzhouxiangella sp.]